jgi:hypothetical protein
MSGIARAVPIEIDKIKVQLDFHIYPILNFDLLIGCPLEKLLQEKSSQGNLYNEFRKTAFATPFSCPEIPTAKHYLDHDLPKEVKFVSPFISPKPVFHPYETERPSSPLFNFKPCPSVSIFHDESFEKENFCATDPPDDSGAR